MFDVETYAIIKKRIASGIGGSTSGSAINDTEISEDTMLSSQKMVDTVCPPFSVSGPIVQCTPVENYELGVKVDIVPVQEGEGDPSPENVRPIVGWDNVNVRRAGKNLLDWSKVSAFVFPAYGLSFEKKENSIRIFGTSTQNGYSSFNIATTTQSELYGKNFIFSWFTNEENVINIYGLRTTSENAIAINMNLTEGSSYDFTIQIAVGTEKLTSYEPYRGQTYVIQLGQTVYGGTISINNGVAQTNYAVVEFDGSDDENWRKLQHESGKIYYITKVLKNVINANDPSKWVCNRLQPHQYNYAAINYHTFSIGFQSDRISVCIVLENESTLSVEEFKVWLGENPVQFVYDSDLVDLNFDPKTITSISGTNTLYADAGNITVTGVSDPGAAIATLQDRLTALENNTLN